GAFAQYVKVPEWNLIRLEDSINYKDATYIEPLTCVVRSFEQGQVGINDKVVILGEGRIGLLHTQLAREYGVEQIIVTGLFDSRLALAKEFGANHIINVRNADPVEFVSNNTSDGVNVVFDTTGIVSAAEEGVRMLAPHGRFVSFAGFPNVWLWILNGLLYC
ncbi:MAG: zinc-binding dehydrogenase, partial [Candidatus Hodarchaeales archaeon]